MSGPRFNGLLLLTVSSLVLMWRLADFVDEALSGTFHMTRNGLAVWGAEAEFIQLAMVLVSFALVGMAIANLVRLRVAYPPR